MELDRLRLAGRAHGSKWLVPVAEQIGGLVSTSFEPSMWTRIDSNGTCGRPSRQLAGELAVQLVVDYSGQVARGFVGLDVADQTGGDALVLALGFEQDPEQVSRFGIAALLFTDVDVADQRLGQRRRVDFDRADLGRGGAFVRRRSARPS